MKNLAWGIAGILIAIVVSWVILDIYVFEDGSVFTTSTRNSDAVSRLDAVGEDLRIYEFTPKTAPHIQCLFVAGEEGKGGLFCFDKEPTPTKVTP